MTNFNARAYKLIKAKNFRLTGESSSKHNDDFSLNNNNNNNNNKKKVDYRCLS